ncbi:hypothetical protein LZ30DRAFT_725330 [Colletotrichum cereale]|nr:hypothetical protein LZ30DRAFT_725330 [Colletotrichum cereale]
MAAERVGNKKRRLWSTVFLSLLFKRNCPSPCKPECLRPKPLRRERHLCRRSPFPIRVVETC